VWLVLATVLSAALVVLVTRGNIKQVARLHLNGMWLLAIGLVIQATLEFIRFPKSEITTIGYAALMASYAFILGFCITNLANRGFGVIAVGVAMNALVIGLNQGMPTKPIGNDARGHRVFKPIEQTVKHRQSRGDDLLGALGDRILFPRPFDEIVSFGDLVIAVGVCELVYYASRRERALRRHAV
jgi:chromate transport protein ChrA